MRTGPARSRHDNASALPNSRSGMMQSNPQPLQPRTWLDPLYDPKIRGIIFQVLLVLALLFLAYEIVTNTAANLKRQNIASGFDFLSRTAGFDISQSMIP